MTDPGNLKAFGTQQRPVILDISQLIRKVQWIVGKSVMALRINSKVRTPHTPTADIISSDGAYTGEAYANAINIHDTFVPVPIIVFPKISKEMFAHSIEWNKSPPLIKTSDETFSEKTQLIFFNLKRLKSFNDFKDDYYQMKILFPGSQRKTVTGFTYWIYYDPFGYPFQYYYDHPSTSGIFVDQEGHIEVWSFPAAVSKEERAKLMILNAGSEPPLRTYDEPTTTHENDLAQWKLEAWTFKNREEFPVKLIDYTWNFDWQTDEKTKAYKTDKGGSNVDEITPSYTVTLRVNFKTLALEMTKA